jgi:putative DNA primase/helicase
MIMLWVRNRIFLYIKVIKFDKIFDPKTANTNLSQEIIDTELSGLLNWIIEGYNDICENVKNGNQFSKCDKSEQFLQEYHNSLDSVIMFMNYTGYKVGDKHSVTLKSLLHGYELFYRDRKLETNIMTDRQLAKHLREKLGYRTEKPKGESTVVYCSYIDDDSADS